MKRKIWFITGISSGIGAAIADTAMKNGDFVVGTFRRQEQVDAFNRSFGDMGLALKLDLADPDAIDRCIAAVTERFGGVDALVNNAGYGLAGAVEEVGIDELRAIFEVNFFGVHRLTQGLLPAMRSRGSGRIIQISSHAGFKGFAGFGAYSASKFALEGYSEALAQELEPVGIKTIIVEPGPFRTKFAGRGLKFAKTEIGAYRQTAGMFRQKIAAIDGMQEGDPLKAAEAIYEAARSESPPLRLPLGKTAIATLSSKIEMVLADLKRYKAIAESVVFKSEE